MSTADNIELHRVQMLVVNTGGGKLDLEVRGTGFTGRLPKRIDAHLYARVDLACARPRMLKLRRLFGFARGQSPADFR